MGCGLSKLQEPEDSSPGKIYSTLKRAQVESRSGGGGGAHEYVLLDFSLEGSRPTVQSLGSLCDLPQALQPYYTQGYMLAALHPIILSVGRTRGLACSLLYRAILTRPRSRTSVMPLYHGVPVLRVEEWPLPGDSLTDSAVRALIDKLNRCARGGWRFVGSVLQQVDDGSHGCSGGGYVPPARVSPEDGDRGKSSYSRDLKLLVLFHSWAPCCPPLDPVFYCYHHGALSMRVSRKGHVLSALEADWLEMTTTYYRKGWSLVDSFVYWDTPKGEPLPRSLEGLFVYEECSTAPPSNDAIVVEQWTVVEGSSVKTDYGPLLYTLAEFGWLLTCVLPTPIIRQDSEGDLATKQVLFLQRPVSTQAAAPQQKRTCQKMISSSSVCAGVRVQTNEVALRAGTVQETSAFEEDCSSTLSQLEDSCFEQDDSASEVTCM